MQADATPGRFSVDGADRGRHRAAAAADSIPAIAAPTTTSSRRRRSRELGGQPKIQYALDTKRARTEVRAQVTQARLLRDLVARRRPVRTSTRRSARTLYNLLVPVELEAFLTSAGETQIELDEGTAGIPWETARRRRRHAQRRTAVGDSRRSCCASSRPRRSASRSTTPTVAHPILVIGEPDCPPDYPPLPGRISEAKAVFDCLSAAVPGCGDPCRQGDRRQPRTGLRPTRARS